VVNYIHIKGSENVYEILIEKIEEKKEEDRTLIDKINLYDYKVIRNSEL